MDLHVFLVIVCSFVFLEIAYFNPACKDAVAGITPQILRIKVRVTIQALLIYDLDFTSQDFPIRVDALKVAQFCLNTCVLDLTADNQWSTISETKDVWHERRGRMQKLCGK
jgi:hypothetical protein